MKYFTKIVINSQLVISLLLILSQPLRGQSDVPICRSYGKVGQILSELVLPIDLQSLTQFINGISPEVKEKITTTLLASVSEEEMTMINQMSEEDRELLFKMAGFQTIKTLFQGQAETPEAVNDQLYQQCLNQGVDALIEEMR